MKVEERPSARERHFREMSVWHEWPLTETDRTGLHTNVSPAERIASLIGGGALLYLGLKKRTTPRMAATAVGATMLQRGIMGHCYGYRALGINTARRGSAEPADFYEYGIQVAKSVTVNASPQTLYNFWRDFTNLPAIMSHLHSVEVIDDLLSHWVVKGPLNSRIEWDAEIINEEPHELIAWRSLPGAEVDNAGSVRFVRAPGNRGTHVRVNIEYIPAAGKIGSLVAKIFGEEPNQQVREDLRRFKQVMEAGEVPSTEGQPRGQCKGRSSRGYGVTKRLQSAAPPRGFAGTPNPSKPIRSRPRGKFFEDVP